MATGGAISLSGLATAQWLSVTCLPGLCGWGAGAWGWSSSAREDCSTGLLQALGKDGAPGAAPGAHHLAPCLSRAPALQALPPPRPRVLGAQHDLVLGVAVPTAAGAGQWEREQDAGLGTSSISGASSPSPVQALIHVFIRINEAYNKCIGEAKQAAERQSQWMRAGENEKQSGHCADLGSCMGACWSGLCARGMHSLRTHSQTPA